MSFAMAISSRVSAVRRHPLQCRRSLLDSRLFRCSSQFDQLRFACEWTQGQGHELLYALNQLSSVDGARVGGRCGVTSAIQVHTIFDPGGHQSRAQPVQSASLQHMGQLYQAAEHLKRQS